MQENLSIEPKIVVEVDSVKKNFDKHCLFKNLTLSLIDKEHLAILGPGGSGKSTLLKIILGLVAPDAGKVCLFGEELALMNRQKRQQTLKNIGMAFQQGALFDFLTVRENILFAMENITDFSKDFMEEQIQNMLSEVKLLDAINKLPSELSGGMRRRVGIVRALATHPKIALLDEPTAGLDPVNSTVVINMIHNLANSIGTSLICVTSNIDVAYAFSSKIAVLNDGEIIATGTKDDLHKIDNKWLQHFLTVRAST